MDSRVDNRPVAAPLARVGLKIVIAGGFGVGKTTMVGAVSEIPPLMTEERITERSVGIDDLSGIESKETTTVALDFGRITLTDQHVLYLFGTPGQDRFWFMWDELAEGAIGAVVLVDTRPERLHTSFAAIDYFEKARLPFVVAVNVFAGAARYPEEAVRKALDLRDTDVPLVFCDARSRSEVKETLLTLVEHAIAVRSAEPAR